MSEFYKAKFNIFVLMFLFFVLIICHSAMVHWGRPAEMIHWVENFVAMVMGALVQQLSDHKKDDDKTNSPVGSK